VDALQSRPRGVIHRRGVARENRQGGPPGSESTPWTIRPNSTLGQDQSLIEHWNGTNWKVVPSPNPGTGGDHPPAVKAISSISAWAVGDTYNGERSPRSSPSTGTGEQRADALIAAAPARSWQRLSTGAGAHGPREFAWALVPVQTRPRPGCATTGAKAMHLGERKAPGGSRTHPGYGAN
jgi:hypothetical protein